MDYSDTDLAHRRTSRPLVAGLVHRHALDLLNLPILQLQRRRPAEDGGDDADHSLVGHDFVDFAFEVDEGTIGDLDAVALVVLDVAGDFALGLLGGFDQARFFGGLHRTGLAVGSDEIAYAIGFF